ncbi:MAG: molecular chaperone TorD family protein [Burkholderiaceae bacterium]|nr:molecular chaperone TorD family protein [Burkholderiaceae bacterium]
MSATTPIAVDLAGVAPEDAARARWYGLFATLFRAPPSAQWLAAIASSRSDEEPDDEASPLGRAWNDFARACAQADAEAVREEFDTAFIGVAKADVIPYASYHLSGFLNDRPLVELREHLAGLGLARRADIGETEDHLSALCETMAWLIAGDAGPARDFAAQRAFFARFLGALLRVARRHDRAQRRHRLLQACRPAAARVPRGGAAGLRFRLSVTIAHQE